MSKEEKKELVALTAWLKTFPKIEQIAADKENAIEGTTDWFLNANVASCILQVAHEVCSIEASEALALSKPDRLWDTIISMTSKSNKRKSFEPPPMDTPHMWNDQTKHDALAGLLDGAVTHASLHQRKIYIERIMALPGGTQRSLMSLIERRKQKTFKSPSVKVGSSSARKKTKTEDSAKAPVSYQPKPTPPKSRSRPPNPDARPPFSPPVSNSQATPNHASGKASSFLETLQGKGPPSTPQQFVRGAHPRSLEETFASNQRLRGISSQSPTRIVGTQKLLFSPGLGDNAAIERELLELREKNIQLETDLGQSRKREMELSQKVEDVEAGFRKQMIKVEADAQLREQEAQDAHKSEVATLRCDIESLAEEFAQAERAKEELAGMKEEMELMLHTKGMLADTTERLRKYKEKLQQLTDVKDALKREEEAHSKSVEECLRLENEVKALQPVKRQLEEYKTRAVDAEVRFAEAQEELRKLAQDKQTLQTKNEELLQGKNAQQEEVEEIHHRFQQERKEENDATGVGEGLSELNPELKEEVLRLRNENVLLREFASKREDDAVQQMEKDLEDAARLSERFKSQFLSVKADLAATQTELEETRDRETKLKANLNEWTKKAMISQEQANKLSGQLHKSSDDLMASEAKVTTLENELTGWIDQAKANEGRSLELSEHLATCTEELEATRDRESSLKAEVADWIKQAKDSQERANELSEQLQQTSNELNTMQEKEASLTLEVIELTNQAKTLQQTVDELYEKLNTCTTELSEVRTNEAALMGLLSESQDHEKMLSGQLDECKNQLSQARDDLEKKKQTEQVLRNDLADMTSRAEDSEAVSKQRMELVQSTREKLTASQQHVEDLKHKEEQLLSDVTTWIHKAKESDEHNKRLENEVAEIRASLCETRGELAAYKDDLESTSKERDSLQDDLTSWQEKASSAEALTERLQEELVQTRDILNKTQTSLRTSRDSEATKAASLDEEKNRVRVLESSLERTKKSRQDAISQLKNELERSLAELSAQHEKDMLDTEAKVNAQLKEKVSIINQHKQDLLNTQETLDQVQSSLTEIQNQEKMSRKAIAELEEMRTRLQSELEESHSRITEVQQKSAESLDATQEMHRADLKRRMDELQSNMNQLLEDERRAKRMVDDMRQEELRQAQEKASKDLDEAKRDTEDRILQCRQEYERQLEGVEQRHKEDKDKLMTRGKELLKHAKDEVQAREQEISELRDKLSVSIQEKEKITIAFRSKLSEYKKQLQFSTKRINDLSNNADELEESVRSLEREKFKLEEENNLYRRQLGGRFGSDAKLQNQLEMLQQEFKTVLEELRELKRKSNVLDHMVDAGLAPINEAGQAVERSYSRDAVNQSTLVQLRSEYEATLEVLNDEKRELVMRNSAAINDVQKAEKRAYEADQANASLKHELTSLKLQNERLQDELTSMKGEVSFNPTELADTAKQDGRVRDSMKPGSLHLGKSMEHTGNRSGSGNRDTAYADYAHAPNSSTKNAWDSTATRLGTSVSTDSISIGHVPNELAPAKAPDTPTSDYVNSRSRSPDGETATVEVVSQEKAAKIPRNTRAESTWGTREDENAVAIDVSVKEPSKSDSADRDTVSRRQVSEMAPLSVPYRKSSGALLSTANPKSPLPERTDTFVGDMMSSTTREDQPSECKQS